MAKNDASAPVSTPVDPTEFAAAVGRALREARRAKRWSQTAVARAIQPSVTQQTLAQYESGESALLLTRFVELCRVLGVRPGVALDSVVDGIAARAAIGPTLDLVALSHLSDRPGVAPLSTWARVQMRELGQQYISVTLSDLAAMGDVAGIPLPDLVAVLAPALIYGQQ